MELRTRTPTLREPAQSKRMSVFYQRWQKNHSIRKLRGKIPRPRWSPERGHILCASLRASQNEPRTRTTQNADIHVVRACAVATHVNITQKPLDMEIFRKMPLPRQSPERRRALCDPTQSKRTSRLHKSHFSQKFARKITRPRLGPKRGHTFCASLRSGNACHDFTTATLRKFTGEMPQTKTAPQTLCEPAQSKRM